MAVKWMKTGDQSQALAKTEAAEAAKRKEEQGKMWRFYMKDGEEARITFLDGDLSPQGFLVPPRFYEHTLHLHGSYQQFVCPEKTNPEGGDKCPLCASGDKPYLVSLFTVIDHREFKGKDDKVHKDRPKLFAAKNITFETLNKIAGKIGGLAGQTFDVSRVGEKSAAVGSLFIPIEKRTLAQLAALYTVQVKDPKTGNMSSKNLAVPADYDAEIVYRTAAELAALGLGKPGADTSGMNPGGNAQPPAGQGPAANGAVPDTAAAAAQYKDQL